MVVSLGEVPQGEPCFPRFVVESSPSQPAQEVASSPFLLAPEALVRLESILPRTGVAQEISLGTRALLVLVQSLLQLVQGPWVSQLSSPQISEKVLAQDAERRLEGHVV